MLRHFGVLAGEAATREQLGLEPAVIVRATEDEYYSFAPESGLWETFVDVGDRVEPGQPLGQIHFIERPDREPEPVITPRSTASSARCARSRRPTRATSVAVVGREIERGGARA